MRYTEYEFKLDHVFDFIRLIFSSIFLSPFRLINEITKKIIYLPKELVVKIVKIAFVVDIVVFAGCIVDMVLDGKFNFIHGKLPLLSCIVALVLIGAVYYVVEIHQQPELVAGKKKKVVIQEKEVPKDLTLEDEDLIHDSLTDEALSILEDKPIEKEEPIEKVEPVKEEVKETVEDIGDKPIREATVSQGQQIIDNIDESLGNNYSEIADILSSNSNYREDELKAISEDYDKSISLDEFDMQSIINCMENGDDEDTLVDLPLPEIPGMDSNEDLLKAFHNEDLNREA